LNSTQQRNKTYSKEFRPFVITEARFNQVRLIDESEQYHESFLTADAIKKARSSGLSLVCFSRGNRKTKELPLCKIIDYGKWKYAQGKKLKEQNLHKKHVTKEIQFSIGISEHDIEHKVKQTKKFLEHKMDVRFVMKLFGRDRVHFDIAEEKMQQIIKLCANFGKVHDIKKTSNMIVVRLVAV